MPDEPMRLTETEHVGAFLGDRDHLAQEWHVAWTVERWHGDWSADQLATGLAGDPYDVSRGEGNLLVYGGASALFNRLINAAPTVTAFDNANARLGVGDSTVAEAAGQTDLQAAVNKVRVGMNATYPQHTDGTTSGSATVTWQAAFDGATANFDWREWALFNAGSGGRMLNRKVFNQGTKAAGSTWQFTVTATLA